MKAHQTVKKINLHLIGYRPREVQVLLSQQHLDQDHKEPITSTRFWANLTWSEIDESSNHCSGEQATVQKDFGAEYRDILLA